MEFWSAGVMGFGVKDPLPNFWITRSHSSVRRFLALILVFATTAFATTTLFEPLTQETLTGTWEAVMPIDAYSGAGVYRMEISATSESWLVGVFVPAADRTFVKLQLRLVDSGFTDGRIKLSFEGDWLEKKVKVIFEGSGMSAGNVGQFHGKFRKEDGLGFETEQEVYFRKGSWTRDLKVASESAEEELRKLQRASKQSQD
jgi:hypothetical protein